MFRSQETNPSSPAAPATDPVSDPAKLDRSDTKTTAQTTTKTEAPTKQAPSQSETPPPSHFAMLLMWLPFVVAMGLWLYLRGRNQAAERARAEALIAATKKAKKSSRSQNAPVKMDDATGSSIQSASSSSNFGGSSNKSSSKKKKKDKQKKKQPVNSGVNAGANSGAAVSKAASALKGQAALAPQVASDDPNDSLAGASDSKPTVATPSVNKAIFEPLRKVTETKASAADANNEFDATDGDSELRDAQDAAMVRKRRSPPPPVIVTTPTKVSSGRFEKLNVPAASAGVGANASRWPAEAARPAAPVRVAHVDEDPELKSAAPKSSMAQSFAAQSAATRSTPPAPVTGRGLGAFVKVNKRAEPTTTATPADHESNSVANEVASSSDESANGNA